jgi:hypothetical protein
MLTTFFLSFFGFFSFPRKKFPSGAFVVVQEATQNELSGMMGVFVICYNMKQQNAHNFVSFFVWFFFLPLKFPSGAFVIVQEATQNELSGMMGVFQICYKMKQQCSQLCLFVCLFFSLPHISIVELVVWEQASHERFSIKWRLNSRTSPKSKKLVQP